MLPDFNRLRVFYYIFRNNSIAAAAGELHITQSAVSQHLSKLEDELKVRLFIRLHKRIIPSPEGESLFGIIKPFIEQMEEYVGSVKRPLNHPYGLIRIGAPVEFGKRYMPILFAEFRNQYPDVSFDLVLGHPAILLPCLREGRLDFAFADIFVRKGEFTRELAVYSIEPVIDEELILVCSRTYFEKKLRKEQGIRELMNGDFISYQLHYPALRSWFRHHYNKHAIKLNIAMTIENVEGVLEGVRNNIGMGILPSHIIRDQLGKGELIHIRTRKKELINHISLIQLLDKVPNMTERTFLEYFRNFINAWNSKQVQEKIS
ncbi:MAG: LysR family transcriptional regulator [Deltaproteobacteria bacterium]|nr:LysR family transcriptional regulator [Deltaproteobacteria bacterium]